MEFHAVEFLQKIVREFDVRLVNFVDQKDREFGSGEGFPELSLADVIRDVVDAFVAELPVAKTRYRIIFIKALMRLCGGFHVPFDQRCAHCLGEFIGQNGLAGAGLAFDK